MPHRYCLLAVLALFGAILGCSIPGNIRPSQLPTPAAIEPIATVISTQPAGIPTDTMEVVIPTETATETLQYGTVNGRLSYPSEFLPPQRVILYLESDFTQYYFVDTQLNQGTYTIQVPAGTYFVVAYVIDNASFAAGYSAAVPCGLSVDCNDHALIPITVTAGATLNDINPGDWYAPEGSFPPMP